MSWLFHRWLVLCGVSLLVIKGCRCFFLRHTSSGKCIAAEKNSFWSNEYGHRYFAVLSDCLNVSGQLQYWPNSETVHNMARKGTLLFVDGSRYKKRLIIYDATNKNQGFERDVRHSMKQRDAGPLFFYNIQTDSCAQPDANQKYMMRKKNGCDDTEKQQKFTFGSVTQYGDKMKDVHCSPVQRMVIHKAHYGDFNKSGIFDANAAFDAQCSGQASCEVKSLCGEKRSCELTVDNNLLSSQYCSDTTKELFIEYTCVDNYNINPITTASNIRLSKSPNEGFIEVKNDTTWRKVIEENWDKDRQKMLCEHLGFSETSANTIRNMEIAANEEIASGDLVCYNTGSGGTSCCVHLVPSTTTTMVDIPYAKCKICDKPALLQDESTFADSVFSGSGSSGYSNARFTKDGWCTQTPQTHYLLIDLLKDYHITQVVTMGNKDQTKGSDQYTMTYSHDNSFSNSAQITGSKNGFQASMTALNIYNVRHIKIKSTGKNYFCLRIELCGEVQTPAPVQDIKVTPSNTSADVTWKIPEPKDSSYITNYNIFINGKLQQTISRETYDNKFNIRGLKPYTDYKVDIETEDGSGEKGSKVSEDFKTKEGVPSGPPMNVTFTFRSKYSLQLSWTPPESNLHNGILTGYQVCYSFQTMSTSPKCVKPITTLTLTIDDLQPSTRYFVTVAAGTSAGFGNKSSEINKTTNGVPSGPPLNVTFISRSKTSLRISWKAPVESTRKSKLTGYRVCFSTNDTSPECLILKSTKVLSLTLNNLRPSTKYFVTVSASTEHGYGEKSPEVSKITNKGPVVNLIATSFYTLTVNIPKQQEYIKEVMVIVQSSANDQVSSEDIKTSDLKNFQSNTRDPYITAYLKADVLPLMFVIGDGKSYSSEEENYHNQPLTANSNYVVFLRFFESQDSYYSTEWSDSVYTMGRPSAKHSESENADNSIRFFIPIIILALYFLLSLGVIIYQRRLLQNRKKEFDANKEPKIGNKYVNEGNTVYETPDDVIEEIERNEGVRGTDKGQESSNYMSLKDKKEPANVYQAFHPHGTNDGQSHSKVGGQNSVEYQNPVFSADPNAA